ncbi:MAG: hypothetical protein RRA94_05090 [Bacteroidota bacterium]|nr:hypothetical protein [Bacteroidota bacterium]
MTLYAVTFAVFLLNLPFGYWRENTRKFSIAWVLAIHLPVPLVIALRHVSGLGWEFYTYPFLVAAFFLGQYAGVRLSQWRATRLHLVTGCLVMDVWRERTRHA